MTLKNKNSFVKLSLHNVLGKHFKSVLFPIMSCVIKIDWIIKLVMTNCYIFNSIKILITKADIMLVF